MSQPIPITQLPVKKLQEILATIEQRCDQWAESAQTLNGALLRYEETRDALNSMGAKAEVGF